MGSSIEELQYHIVWSTKYRYNLLTAEVAEVLKNYFLKKQKHLGYQVKSMAVEPDHIHLLLRLKSSQTDLNGLIRKLKGGSSFLLRKQFKFLNNYPSLWTPSHFIASVGDVSDGTVEEYLNKQEIEEKEIVQRTFKYRVFDLTHRKERLLKQYFKACLKNDKKRVPAGILQDFKRIKRKENEFGLYLRAQLLKLEVKENQNIKYWLRIPGSRYEKPFWLGLMGRDLPEGYRLGDSTIREKDGTYYVYLTIEQERVIKRASPNRVISVDLGISHPITAVELNKGRMKSWQFYGKEIKNQIYRRQKRYSQLQRSGVKNPGKRLSKYTNRIREIVHSYTNRIIEQARETGSSIVVGDLRGIKDVWVKGKTNKTMRRKANRIPYGRIMSQLWYKGTLAGIPVVFVSEAYTSQRCSLCGSVNQLSRQGGVFKCRSCGYTNQADLNGAINLGTFALTNLLSQSHLALKQETANTSLLASAIGR